MRIRRRLPLVFAVLAIAAAVAVVVVLRKHAPPEPARLLPSADGFVYINLKWMRRANIGGELPVVSHDPEYEQFIAATGFQFERDLDEAALAIHSASAQPSSSGASPETRFSEVFVGKLQGERLSGYLRKNANAVEDYRSIQIYNIPLEGRTLRVAILGVDSVAASNYPDPQVIRGIIDRSRKLASPFGGPALLRQYYKEVPFASLGWTIFKLEPGKGGPGAGNSEWSFLFSRPAVVVASLRYLGAVHVRAEAFTASEDEAKEVTQQAGTFLSVLQAAGGAATPGQDADVKAVFDSLKVEQQKNRAVLTAIVPVSFIRKMLAATPLGAGSPQQSQPAPPQKGKGGSK